MSSQQFIYNDKSRVFYNRDCHMNGNYF